MSLPVHDDVMMRMLEALVQVGATAKSRRQMVSQAASQANSQAAGASLPSGWLASHQLQPDLLSLPPLGCRSIS
jgi:hypothetical protein